MVVKVNTNSYFNKGCFNGNIYNYLCSMSKKKIVVKPKKGDKINITKQDFLNVMEAIVNPVQKQTGK
jgi:uncharacterized membrane protein YcgQ (UPF0703/DUF1980 family)